MTINSSVWPSRAILSSPSYGLIVESTIASTRLNFLLFFFQCISRLRKKKQQNKTKQNKPNQTKPNQILKQLHVACQNEDGSDDSKKGTQLLEVYALEIQMYTETKNNKKLKELYKLSLHIKSAIPHPRIMGVIRECGGKMHMRECQSQLSIFLFFSHLKTKNQSLSISIQYFNH